MAKSLSGVIIHLKNGTKAAIEAQNPTPAKGEFLFEIDTHQFKVGDGATAYNNLPYGGMIVSSSSTNGHIKINGNEMTVYQLPSNVPLLGEDGKLDNAVLPALSISSTSVVADQAAMLALDAQEGDLAVRTDGTGSWILTASPASTLANWTPLAAPTDAVRSVNAKTGIVVLTTSDISEGADHLYFTDARASASFAANFAQQSYTGLSDGNKLISTDDTLIIDCGTVQ